METGDRKSLTCLRDKKKCKTLRIFIDKKIYIAFKWYNLKTIINKI